MTVRAERSQKNDGDKLVDNYSYSNVTHRIHVWIFIFIWLIFPVNGPEVNIPYMDPMVQVDCGKGK